MSIKKEQQVVQVTYAYTKRFRVPFGIDLDNRIVYGIPNSLQIHFDSWEGFGDDDTFVEVRLLTNYTNWYHRKHK